MNTNTIPNEKHGNFLALTQGKVDYVTEVISVSSELGESLMIICSIEGAIYISKEQAMAFFDLEER